MASLSDDDALRHEASNDDAPKSVAQAGAEARTDAAGDLLAQGASAARDRIDELPATMSDAMAVGERIVLTGRRQLDRGVRRQPVEALLLAGAIGYLIGWLTSRDRPART